MSRANANLVAVLERGFPRDLDSPCIETQDGLVYTWRDLQRGTGRIANWLASLNLAAGARVAVQVDKSPECVMLYLATLRAGLVYLPLNTAYQRAEIEYFLRDAEPAVVVCTPARAAEFETIARAAGASHVVTLGERRDGTLLAAAAPFADDFAAVRCRADDLAAIVYTSGTTGRSKGAMVTHGNLTSNAQTLDRYWGFAAERAAGRRDTLLHALPLFHVHGLFVALHAALLAGARLIMLPRFELEPVLTHLPRSTVFMGVPTYYTRLLADPGFGRRHCERIRVFISGSAPLAADTHREFEQRTGHVIVERYGMSETVMLVSNPYFKKDGERLAGTVGKPLPGVDVRVVREDGRRCAPGDIGAVEVRGPNVFRGYWRMPDKTREEFTVDGWFKTGDVGQFGGPGLPDDVLSLVGRSKDLVISGGYNVYPKEIEQHLDELPGVVESAVIGLPHPDFGEAVAAVVVVQPAAPFDPQAAVAALKERIANYKIPKRIFVVSELPRNTMGKVQKAALRERYRATFIAS